MSPDMERICTHNYHVNEEQTNDSECPETKKCKLLIDHSLKTNLNFCNFCSYTSLANTDRFQNKTTGPALVARLQYMPLSL